MGKSDLVHVVLEQTVYHIDKPYTYFVPEEFLLTALPGCRVIVPFGNGNNKRQGMIIGKSVTTEHSKIKPIINVIDKEPILTKEMIDLAEWIKKHTFCTWFDVFKTMIPYGINFKIVSRYTLAQSTQLKEIKVLDDELKSVAEYIAASKKGRTLEEIVAFNKGENGKDNLMKLIKKGIVIRDEHAVRKMHDASLKMISLTEKAEDLTGIKITPKQKSVLTTLYDTNVCSVKELCYFSAVTPAVICSLQKKGLVDVFDSQYYRRPYDIQQSGKQKKIQLTKQQQKAYKLLKNKYDENIGAAALLYGVTGSGKTQVFLQLCDDVIAQNKGVIVMVPEISLTPQIVALFHERFGKKVAVFHSAMSQGQKMDEWKRVKSGEAKIAIGTRSAVFAPFDDLGLIIMDEEHEHTYKSEKSPRYHARDVAKYRAFKHKALLLLCSATPSLESFIAAQSGRYLYCELDKRYGNAKLPEVISVDMRNELCSGNNTSISKVLYEYINNTLKCNQQVILLLNRRGHNTFIVCPSCGYVITCKNCSISMTYHSKNNRLMCHYCGASTEYIQTCPNCNSTHMKYSGIGTQRVEEELESLFPQAKILRMDADSMMNRQSYEKALLDFSNNEYDILLGTQMVAKGLNFPNVTLVGVLGADHSMFSDDFRSFEKTFSLLTQVVGRCGRGDFKGTAIIQTLNPENSIIQHAASQDYKAFFNTEICTRKVMVYPPYCDITMIGVSGQIREKVQEASIKVVNMIKAMVKDKYKEIKIIVLGPVLATVPRVNNKYRYRIILKHKNTTDFRNMINDVLCDFAIDKENKDISLFVDVNPDGMI